MFILCMCIYLYVHAKREDLDGKEREMLQIYPKLWAEYCFCYALKILLIFGGCTSVTKSRIPPFHLRCTIKTSG